MRAPKWLSRYRTWLWWGHSLPLRGFGIPGIQFDSAMLLDPLLLKPKGGYLQMKDGRKIRFLADVMLYPEEVELKIEEVVERLLALAEKKDLLDDLLILNTNRPSLVVRNRGARKVLRAAPRWVGS